MKNNFCLIALMLSSSAFAAPYVGLEYGVTSMDSKYTTNFTGDAVSLNPNETNDSFGGFIGYRLNSVGFEFGYKQYDADDSRSQHKGFDGTFPNVIEKEREWNADVDAKQLTFKPVYFHNVNERLQFKAGLGLTYTQYEYKSSSHDEFEHIINDMEHYAPRNGGEVSKDNVFGVIASVGLEYKVIKNLAIGASASYQSDSIASASSLMLTSAYYF